MVKVEKPFRSTLTIYTEKDVLSFDLPILERKCPKEELCSKQVGTFPKKTRDFLGRNTRLLFTKYTYFTDKPMFAVLNDIKTSKNTISHLPPFVSFESEQASPKKPMRIGERIYSQKRKNQCALRDKTKGELYNINASSKIQTDW